MNEMTIGRIAREAGVNVQTIRFYQRIGLVPQPHKPLGGFRRYPGDAVQRIIFIKRAQSLGFSLQEISQLLSLEEPKSCAQTHDLALRKLADVKARVADLNRIGRVLKKLATKCETAGGRIACPIITTLSRADGSPLLQS